MAPRAPAAVVTGLLILISGFAAGAVAHPTSDASGEDPGYGMIQCALTVYSHTQRCDQDPPFTPNVTVGEQNFVRFTLSWEPNSPDARVLYARLIGNSACHVRPPEGESCGPSAADAQGPSPLTLTLNGEPASNGTMYVDIFSEAMCREDGECEPLPPANGVRVVRDQVFHFRWEWG